MIETTITTWLIAIFGAITFLPLFGAQLVILIILTIFIGFNSNKREEEENNILNKEINYSSENFYLQPKELIPTFVS